MYDGQAALDGVRGHRRHWRCGGPHLVGEPRWQGIPQPAQPDPFGGQAGYTDDVGALDESKPPDGAGRADEAISTGGLTVLPAPVGPHSRTRRLPNVAVFGVADDRLGQQGDSAARSPPQFTVRVLEEPRDLVVESSLDRTAALREVHVVDALPRRGIGKLDRRFGETFRPLGCLPRR